LNELTDGEMLIFRGTVCRSRFVEQRKWKHDDLLMCRLKVLLVGGYLVNVGSGRAEGIHADIDITDSM